MSHAGLCKVVKCQVVVPDRHEWEKKFSTKSEGRVIVVSHTHGEVVGDSLGTTTYRACEADSSDIDSDVSDVEEVGGDTSLPLRTSAEWKCRVNKTWYPYLPDVSSVLESQFQACMCTPEGIGVSQPFAIPNVGTYRIHFTAERQFRTGDMSCRRAVWRDFQPPTLAALTSPARVEEFLQLPHHGFKRTRAVIDVVVRALHALSPSKVYEGGSFKKQTCLAYDFDVDLVLWLNQFDHSCMPAYKQRVKDALAAVFPPMGGLPQVWYIGETPYCLRLRVRMLSVDIVITGDPKSAVRYNPDRFYEATKSSQRDEAVIDAKDKFPRLHHLILLAKCWKKRKAWSKMGGPISYFVELLCIRAAEEADKHCSLSVVFRCFLQLCEKGVFQITDSLGKQLEVPTEDRDNFRSFAREAVAELGE